MPIYKRCSRCRKRILEGTTCGCYKKRYKEYDKFTRNNKLKEFYGGREWRNARKEALELDDGIDVYVFMTTGEVLIADTVHHIVPLRKAWEKRTDIHNLMSLNHSTHSLIEKMYQEDEDGAIIKLKKILKKYRAEKGEGEAEKF